MGLIYFIQAKTSGLIKIGKTIDERTLILRLQSHQIGSPDRLCLIGTTSDKIIDEEHLHIKFQSIRSHGEWFYPKEFLLRYIEKCNDLSSRLHPENKIIKIILYRAHDRLTASEKILKKYYLDSIKNSLNED